MWRQVAAGNDGAKALAITEESRGWRSLAGYQRDLVHLNRGGERFVDISGVSGADSITDGRAAVFGDFDNDGDHDIFLTTYTGVQENGESSGRPGHLLFRNNLGQDANFVRFTLVGTKSGRQASGAEVRLTTKMGVQSLAKLTGCGFMSGWDERLLFGLGEERSAESLEVRWPSGLVEKFESIEAGHHYRLKEGSGELEVVTDKVSSLGDGVVPETSKIELPAELQLPAERCLVAVFTTWCASCPAELKALQALADSHQIPVVCLSVDKEADDAKVEEFLADLDVRLPFLRGELSDPDLVIPMLLFVDKGEVVKIARGWNRGVRRDALGWFD